MATSIPNAYTLTMEWDDVITFDGADLWTIDLEVLAVVPVLDLEGEELTAFGGRKGKGRQQRRAYQIELVPPTIDVDPWSHAQYELAMRGFRKKLFARMKDTDLERVGSHFDATTHLPVTNYNFWTDATYGRLPVVVYLSESSYGPSKKSSRSTWTLTLVEPELAS